MSKFYGRIGFAETKQTAPSVYDTVITERWYAGDVNKNYRKLENSASVNGDINIANEFSIVADPYAFNPFHELRYIEWLGTLWTITGVLEEYPRLKLTVGGVYTGPTPDT